MSAENTCARCKGHVPTNDNVLETAFWGAIRTETTTTTTKAVRFLATYLRRNPRLGGSPALRVDETQPLCDPCWALLVGRFMQGRSVPAMPGKEDR